MADGGRPKTVTVRQITLALLLWLLAACTSMSGEAPLPSAATGRIEVDLYRAVNGETYIRCSGMSALTDCGERLYGNPESDEHDLLPPSLEGEWANCSTSEVFCILNYRSVMAVPKSDLRAGLIYKVHGAELTVEKCFRALMSEVPAPCGVALISTRCVDDCDCLEESEKNGGVLFYYARSFGITAFFTTRDIKDMRESRSENTWMLVADEGFLKAPLSLKQAPSDYRPCRR